MRWHVDPTLEPVCLSTPATINEERAPHLPPADMHAPRSKRILAVVLNWGSLKATSGHITMAAPIDELFRQTRSGHAFSPWSGNDIRILRAPPSFDTALQLEAAAAESINAMEKPNADEEDELKCSTGRDYAPTQLPAAARLTEESCGRRGEANARTLGDADPTAHRAVGDWSLEASTESATHLRLSESLPALPIPPPCLRAPKIPQGMDSETHSANSRQKQRDKARFKDRRREKRMLQAKSSHNGPAAKQVAKRRAAKSLIIETGLATTAVDAIPAHLPVASTAFVSRNLKQMPSGGSAPTVQQILARGFRYIAWDGRMPYALLDKEERVIGALVGRPRDEAWGTVVSEASSVLEAARSTLYGNAAPTAHRRGCFSLVASGISYGGGQTEPCNRNNSPGHQRVVDSLLAHRAIQRIAGFSSASLQAYAPKLYNYYSQTLNGLLQHHPSLRRNFAGSVFGSATFNLGPQTATDPHIDHLNLPAGLCAITALGSFDHRLGGHLILWDLGLIIEFPPGATVLIPSNSEQPLLATGSHDPTNDGFDAALPPSTQGENDSGSDDSIPLLSDLLIEDSSDLEDGVQAGRNARSARPLPIFPSIHSSELEGSSDGAARLSPGVDFGPSGGTLYRSHSDEATSSEGGSDREDDWMSPPPSPGSSWGTADTNHREPQSLFENHDWSEDDLVESDMALPLSQEDWNAVGIDVPAPANQRDTPFLSGSENERLFDMGRSPSVAERDASQAASPRDSSPYTAATSRLVHPAVNGKPCDSSGRTLPENAPARPPPTRDASDWTPYADRVAFELADLLYRREQMPASNVKSLLQLWAAGLVEHGGRPPFASVADMYNAIDCTPLGDAKWQSFELQYSGDLPDSSAIPPWTNASYSVFYRDPLAILHNMLGNPDFKDNIDYAPYREVDHNGARRLENFMSGEWAWRQANVIARDLNAAQGASFVPVILGSDKTTVSVATGQNEYYPLYCSIGNVHNNVRRAHRNAVAVLGFLAIPKTDRRYANDPDFRRFRRQLFHTSLGRILHPLRQWMERPEVILCGDGHFRKVIYGIGPYIADYPEQALLACVVQGWCPICLTPKGKLEEGISLGRSRDHTELIVREFELGKLWNEYGIVGDIVPFTNDFPRADIHKLLAPDILHQVIKGTFKDHLVTWIEQYLTQTYGEAISKEYLAEIDRRIAVVPPFSQLRHFHEGRGFKQWTGDDSKALMKVYLPAVDGLIPRGMVRSIRFFLEFCYLVRRDVQSEASIAQIREALASFRVERESFHHIWEYGSPNGLCSSITESKHIKAVKEPWRRSNRYEALGQMLTTNQRLDKLAAARVDYADRGMLEGNCLTAMQLMLDPEHQSPPPLENQPRKPKKSAHPPLADEDGAVPGPRVMASVTMAATAKTRHASTADGLAAEFAVPSFSELIRRFLYYQLRQGCVVPPSGSALPLADCPPFPSNSLHISVYYSATAIFCAPSDPSGLGGMRREIIRAAPEWRKRSSRFDCIFVNRSNDLPGLLGMDVARVRLFFAFRYRSRRYECALVHWFKRIADVVDEDTGMWLVEPSFVNGRTPLLSVIHLDTIVRGAHLIGATIGERVPQGTESHSSLDKFKTFYVNKQLAKYICICFKPLTGLTHVLSPMNLLPNADSSNSTPSLYLPKITQKSFQVGMSHTFALSVLLNERGGIINNAIITKHAEDAFCAITDPGRRERDLAWFKERLDEWNTGELAR
ncbi:hypothetical protein ACG7TL_006778 [Trametes sanguinea]